MSGLKQYIQPTIYTVIALLYLCLGEMFHDNRSFTKPIHELYLVLTIYYVYLCFRYCRFNKVMKSLAAVYFLHLGYGLFFCIVGFGTMVQGADPAYFVRTYFNSMSAIFVFYFFSEKRMVDKRWFIWAALVFSVAVFFQHQFSLIRQVTMTGIEAGEDVYNSGYFFLALLPAAAFLKKKPVLMYVMIAYLSVMILICSKRGAIFIAVFADIYLFYQIVKTSRHRWGIVVLSVCITAGLSYFIKDLLVSTSVLYDRIEATLDGDSRGRGEIYLKVWNQIVNDNSITGFLIGNGPYAPLRLCDDMAHNDWLEIGLSMGLSGIILYLRYWVAQIRMLIDAKRAGVDIIVIIATTVFVFINFMKTLFSMSLDDMMIYTISVMGFCFSQCNEWNIKNEKV